MKKQIKLGLILSVVLLFVTLFSVIPSSPVSAAATVVDSFSMVNNKSTSFLQNSWIPSGGWIENDIIIIIAGSKTLLPDVNDPTPYTVSVTGLGQSGSSILFPFHIGGDGWWLPETFYTSCYMSRIATASALPQTIRLEAAGVSPLVMTVYVVRGIACYPNSDVPLLESGGVIKEFQFKTPDCLASSDDTINPCFSIGWSVIPDEVDDPFGSFIVGNQSNPYHPKYFITGTETKIGTNGNGDSSNLQLHSVVMLNFPVGYHPAAYDLIHDTATNWVAGVIALRLQ